jgi:hypothetical protein
MNNDPIEGRLRDAIAAHANTFSASPDAWQHVLAKEAGLSRHRRGRSRLPAAAWLARHSEFVIPAAAAAAVVAVALSATALAHGFSGTTRPGAAAYASAKPRYSPALVSSPVTTTTIPVTSTATPASTAPPTTPPGTTTPAVVSANGIEATVSSTPRAGLLGSTTIDATVTLTGAVPAGKLDFLLGIGPADQGQPGSDELLTISGPGTYHMTTGYTPTQRGAWALTVNLWNQQGLTLIHVSGMAANATSSSPYPQLVTVVS